MKGYFLIQKIVQLFITYFYSVKRGIFSTLQRKSIPDICHGHTDGVRGEKICHVEKFQISVHETCGES